MGTNCLIFVFQALQSWSQVSGKFSGNIAHSPSISAAMPMKPSWRRRSFWTGFRLTLSVGINASSTLTTFRSYLGCASEVPFSICKAAQCLSSSSITCKYTDSARARNHVLLSCCWSECSAVSVKTFWMYVLKIFPIVVYWFNADPKSVLEKIALKPCCINMQELCRPSLFLNFNSIQPNRVASDVYLFSQQY